MENWSHWTGLLKLVSSAMEVDHQVEWEVVDSEGQAPWLVDAHLTTPARHLIRMAETRELRRGTRHHEHPIPMLTVVHLRGTLHRAPLIHMLLLRVDAHLPGMLVLGRPILMLRVPMLVRLLAQDGEVLPLVGMLQQVGKHHGSPHPTTHLPQQRVVVGNHHQDLDGVIVGYVFIVLHPLESRVY